MVRGFAGAWFMEFCGVCRCVCHIETFEYGWSICILMYLRCIEFLGVNFVVAAKG